MKRKSATSRHQLNHPTGVVSIFSCEQSWIWMVFLIMIHHNYRFLWLYKQNKQFRRHWVKDWEVTRTYYWHTTSALWSWFYWRQRSFKWDVVPHASNKDNRKRRNPENWCQDTCKNPFTNLLSFQYTVVNLRFFHWHQTQVNILIMGIIHILFSISYFLLLQ
jgi:hypothetical protein